jgi:23S rRNA (uracil1939-C5)-methyltransferase
MRARLHVRGHRLGFFRENSHDVCDARATRQLLPATVDALERLMAAMRSLGLDAVREIELSENIDATSRVVFLDASAVIDASTLERLAGTDGLTGLGSAFGAYGSPYVTDSLTIGVHSLMLRRHVQAFFQGNRHLLGAFVRHVVRQVPEGTELIDLYAGVGLFSICAAAARGARATAVEGDRIAAGDLASNAAASPAAVTTVCQPVEEFVDVGSAAPLRSRAAGALTVIVDPPRTGLSPIAAAGILRICPDRIVYVSCDAATLARDARKIVDAGYAIERAEAFDLFPNTPHCEIVVVFDRPA